MYTCSTDEQIDFKHKFILLCNKRLMYIPVYQCFFFNEIFIPYVLHPIFTKKELGIVLQLIK